MSHVHVHFFDVATGMLDGRAYSGPAVFLEVNTPPGCGAVSGVTDWRAQRVRLTTVDDFGDLVPQLDDYQPPAPEGDAWQTWSWDSAARRWISAPTLAAVQRDALIAVDDAAGLARARVITVAPGQEAVYLRKREQATAYAAAGYVGAAPPYIAAEAAATGVSAEALAREVLRLAAQWDDLLSPAIEAARIAGKAAVRAATTPEAAQAALQAALGALATIGVPAALPVDEEGADE